MKLKPKAAPAAQPTQILVVDTCGECHWWKQLQGPFGKCKRFPPTPLAGAGVVQPVTQAEDYCGEFASKTPPPAGPVGFAPPVAT